MKMVPWSRTGVCTTMRGPWSNCAQTRSVRVSTPRVAHQASDMEQRVKCGSVDGLASRPGAAECPEQRRWIRLTFAGRDRMKGNRRELPRSRGAGHRRAVPHRGCEGSPCGWTHPLLQAERLDR
jgi:hypothetical protein